MADVSFVIDVILKQSNEIYVDPSTTLTLKFSEPMDYLTVEKNLIFQVFGFEQRKDEEKLNCIPQPLNSNVALATFKGADFNAVWNRERTEVTFQFKDSTQLPDTDRMLVGQITFGGAILDHSGISRKNDFFRLNTENIQANYWFILNNGNKI